MQKRYCRECEKKGIKKECWGFICRDCYSADKNRKLSTFYQSRKRRQHVLPE